MLVTALLLERKVVLIKN